VPAAAAARPRTIDAIVMASAAQRGNGIVYTSDPKDLELLRDCVPQIRIERA
jgi:hypothetical protein